MSVLIKGVTMPKSCGYCFFATSCDKWRLKNWGSPPPPDCPIVPIPPHGRLIDADALIGKLHDEFLFDYDARSVVYADIQSAPTILEEERGKK